MVRDAERNAEQYGQGDPERLRQALVSEIRATPLDPARSAGDLLEDLLMGIRACWLIYREYAGLAAGSPTAPARS